MEDRTQPETAAALPQQPAEPQPPRKQGLPRFFELMGRDLWSLYKASFLCCAGVLPGFALALYGLLGGSLLLTLAGGLVGGLLAAPFVCGLTDTVLRALRDEPGYWWVTYRRAWRANWRDALLPGALLGTLLGLWVFVLSRLVKMSGVPTMVWVCVVSSIFLVVAYCNYLFAQIPAVSLPAVLLFKNSARFFIGALPRTLAAAAVQCVYWALILLYLPYTAPLMLVTGFWLPVLLAVMILYPPLNKAYRLEENIRQLRDAQLER